MAACAAVREIPDAVAPMIPPRINAPATTEPKMATRALFIPHIFWADPQNDLGIRCEFRPDLACRASPPLPELHGAWMARLVHAQPAVARHLHSRDQPVAAIRHRLDELDSPGFELALRHLDVSAHEEQLGQRLA